MRLTLRNILAYMDDILEPEDAEEIGKKIQESEFATALEHRIRDVMRRLRLGAPDVLGRGLGLDPNTVAEYLDHCLADDPVLDFEKICLESGPASDVHLAEVAACHQILALVLGEPAEVDPVSRERMYQLPSLAEAQVEAAESGDSPAAEPAARPRPEALQPAAAAPGAGPSVPEWLREERAARRGWWPTVAAVSLALAFGVFLLAVTGQLGPGSFVGDLLGPKPAEPSLAQGPAPAPEWTPEQIPGRPAEEVGEPPRAPSPQEAEAGAAARVASADRPAGPPGEPAEPPWAPAPDELPTARQELPLERPPASVLPSEPPAVPRADERVVAPPQPPTERSEPTAPPPVTPLAQPAIPEVDAMATDLEDSSVAGAATPPPWAPAGDAAPLPPEVIGQFDSPAQVLLVFDAQTRAWERLPHKAPLTPQTRYLSLPTYRPMIRLADQTRVWLVDGTEIELLPLDEEGSPGLAVRYGQVALEAPDNVPGRLRLQLGNQSGVVTLAEAGARLGIEVARDTAWTADPETQPPPLSVSLYATSGTVLWQGQTDREPVSLQAPLGVTLKDRPFEELSPDQFPSWLVADTVNRLYQMTSEAIEREWEPDKPAMLRLRELTIHRRREYRSLALEFLEYVGDFEPVVAALDNPEEKSAWVDYVEQLRAAVMRGPETAARVRAAMEKLHGSEGVVLYEMLWKYNDDALAGEDAARLVRYLDHNTLAFRVVSFETLKRITKLTFAYRPEDPAAKRQPAIKKWRDRLLPASRAATGTPARTGPSAADSPPAETPPDLPDGFGF